MVSYTAKYTKISAGYMGQLVEWPEVVTEGRDLEECRAMLRDAVKEMVLAYRELGKEIPLGNALIEQGPIEVKVVELSSLTHCGPFQRHSGESRNPAYSRASGPRLSPGLRRRQFEPP
jgi:predicted RNase H-like HicB family nuclease